MSKGGRNWWRDKVVVWNICLEQNFYISKKTRWQLSWLQQSALFLSILLDVLTPTVPRITKGTTYDEREEKWLMREMYVWLTLGARHIFKNHHYQLPSMPCHSHYILCTLWQIEKRALLFPRVIATSEYCDKVFERGRERKEGRKMCWCLCK